MSILQKLRSWDRFILVVICSVVLSPIFSALAETSKSNILNICIHGGDPPYKIQNKNGTWEGFDIAIMQDFASYLNKKPNFIDFEWNSIISALLSHKCDIISVGIVKNAERQKVVSFGDTVYSNNLKLIVNKNQTAIKSMQEFIQKKLIIGIAQGTTSSLYASKEKMRYLEFKNFDEPIMAMLQHKVDGALFEERYIKSMPENILEKINIIGQNVTEENVSCAFRPEEKYLKIKFNLFLKDWLMTNKKEIYEKKYFNSNNN